jgi:hypothetical protein
MKIVFAAVLAFGTLTLSGSPSDAQTYPWCAHYMGRGGSSNCGFSTFAQCQAAISGIGGHCMRNPFYDYPRRRG